MASSMSSTLLCYPQGSAWPHPSLSFLRVLSMLGPSCALSFPVGLSNFALPAWLPCRPSSVPQQFRNPHCLLSFSAILLLPRVHDTWNEIATCLLLCAVSSLPHGMASALRLGLKPDSAQDTVDAPCMITEHIKQYKSYDNWTLLVSVRSLCLGRARSYSTAEFMHAVKAYIKHIPLPKETDQNVTEWGLGCNVWARDCLFFWLGKRTILSCSPHPLNLQKIAVPVSWCAYGGLICSALLGDPLSWSQRTKRATAVDLFKWLHVEFYFASCLSLEFWCLS